MPATKRSSARSITALPIALTWPPRPGNTLLGDAAELMPPVGQGANMAMLDGALLGIALAADRDDFHAADEYEAEMFECTSASARLSVTMPELLMSPGACRKMLEFFQPGWYCFRGEDDELVRWLNGGVGTGESVRNHVEHVHQMWADHGPIFTFAIRSADDDSLAGTIDVQLEQAAYRADQANLAYGLYPSRRGRGFVTRAVNLAWEFIRKNAAVRSALIRVEPDNARKNS